MTHFWASNKQRIDTLLGINKQRIVEDGDLAYSPGKHPFPEQPLHFLQVFIDSKYRIAYNGRYTTDEEITGMLIAVLFAGQHTSSVTSTWTLLSMLANKVSCQ